MTHQVLKRFVHGSLMTIQLALAPWAAQAQEMVLVAGQSIDVGRVFWAEGCSSRLITLVGVDLLEAPPGVQLAIRKEDVQPRQSNCAKVPGGTVVATAREVTDPVAGTLRFRVRYQTLDGPKQSEHSMQLSLRPQQ